MFSALTVGLLRVPRVVPLSLEDFAQGDRETGKNGIGGQHLIAGEHFGMRVGQVDNDGFVLRFDDPDQGNTRREVVVDFRVNVFGLIAGREDFDNERRCSDDVFVGIREFGFQFGGDEGDVDADAGLELPKLTTDFAAVNLRLGRRLRFGPFPQQVCNPRFESAVFAGAFRHRCFPELAPNEHALDVFVLWQSVEFLDRRRRRLRRRDGLRFRENRHVDVSVMDCCGHRGREPYDSRVIGGLRPNDFDRRWEVEFLGTGAEADRGVNSTCNKPLFTFQTTAA
jgi:hypothetical protein